MISIMDHHGLLQQTEWIIRIFISTFHICSFYSDFIQFTKIAKQNPYCLHHARNTVSGNLVFKIYQERMVPDPLTDSRFRRSFGPSPPSWIAPNTFWEVSLRPAPAPAMSVAKMANGVNLLETDITSLSDREYLTEWPPVNESCELESCVKRKQPRINREGSAREDKSCIAQFVSREDDHESRTLWARPALARWWRRRQKERSENDFAKLPKSSNPNTLLRFVAGFVFTVFVTRPSLPGNLKYSLALLHCSTTTKKTFTEQL